MASIYVRKGSPYYWLTYRTPGGDWKKRSTKIRLDSPGGKHRAEVEAHKESATETDLRAAPNGVALDAWVPRFLRQRYETRQPLTYQRYLQAWGALNIFLDERGAIMAGQVTRHLAKQYPFWRTKKHKGVRAASWNTAILELKILGCVLQDALERGEIVGNPISRLGLKRERPKEKNAITAQDQATIEAELLKEETPEWMRASWDVAIRQGCRISETRVPLHRVDLAAEPPTITFETKGKRFHTAPLHAELIPMVERLKKAKAKVLCDLPPNASRTWRRFLHGKLGLKQYSFHCTRVTVVTRLARANFSQPMVKDYVGHASTTVNDVYRKLRPRDLVALSAALGDAAAVPAGT